MRDHKKLFKVGNSAQEEKLLSNEFKGDFPRNIWKLYFFLLVEVLELGVEILLRRLKEIRWESADVSNYGHMIILECERRLAE